MAAAASGEGHTIAYGGTAQYDYAPDVGRAFALAARAATDGAHVANFPGEPSTMQQVVDAIDAAAPAVAGRVSWEEGQLPFPESLQGNLLERLLGPLPHTSLADGVRATVEHYQRAAP
jgi:nucleoside-diphosphate-sugar epimerase